MEDFELDDLLIPLREKIRAVAGMDILLPVSGEVVLKFALRSELERLRDVPDVDIPLYERVRLRMREMHISWGEMADACGVSNSTISRYLSGKGRLNSEQLERVLLKLKMLR